MPKSVPVAATAAVLLCACVEQTAAPPTTALFAVPRGGVLADDFFALPFPNDFWRDGDRIDLSLYPRPSPIVGTYVDAMTARIDGFGTNAAIHLRFDGAIDPATLPATPEDARADGASVYLVDVDATSPARGTRWPLRFRFDPDKGETIGTNWLAVLPYPGFPLASRRTYAVVVTTRVAGADGGPVQASADWLAVRGAESPDDADLARAQTAAAPLLAWLDEPGGDERGDVVSAAVFTTQDTLAIMPAVRAAVWQLPAPAIRDVTKLDTNPDWVGFDGTFDAPSFQTGDVPYYTTGGEIVVDDAGVAIVQRTEALRVSFSVPTGTMPASGWPIAIYAHGTGGSYHSYLADGTAARLAAQGLAVMSIDQVLHGPRNPNAAPETSFFNFINPLAARDNALQGAADDFSVVRLIQGLAYSDPDLGTIRFDPARIYFFGHSQGGLTGPPFLAFEPEVKGAVLSGAGALLYLALLTKTEPIDITALVDTLIDDDPLDEFNPTLALLQTWVERSDPANYAPLLIREAATPKPIFQSEGLFDSFAPPATIEALAVAIGEDPVGPLLQEVPGLALRGRAMKTAPVQGNVDGTTAVLCQYPEAEGSDGHFVVFDVPAAELQSAAFLGTLAATGEAMLVTP